MPKAGTLSDGARVHVVRDAAITFRENGGPEDEHDAMKALSRLAYGATPIARDVEIEVWGAIDDERELAITLRVARWRKHAVVLGIAVRATDAPRIANAVPTEPALREYCEARRVSEQMARAELRVAAWDAVPVDVEVSPELWRYRSGLTEEDTSIRIVRTGGDRAPLIVKAEPRR